MAGEMPRGEQSPREEEEPRNALDTAVFRLTEKQWRLCQVMGGCLLGLLGGFCLFRLGSMETFSSTGLLLAVFVLMLVPNILQRNLRRSIGLGRTVSVITFAAMLLLEFLLFLLER